MSKRVRLKVSGSLGGDLTTVSIYKNSITASNLLTASITASAREAIRLAALKAKEMNV